MRDLLIVITAAGLSCQIAAAIFALRLVRVTGVIRVWLLVAAALFLLALLPLVGLVELLRLGPAGVGPTEIWMCFVEAMIAVLLLIGMVGIAPIYRAALASQDAMQIDRDELEQQVQNRTADLLGINTALIDEIETRKKAQAAQREVQKHLQNLLEMYERDRQLVAYEIHDGFVQHATGAVMSLQAAESQFADDPKQAEASVAQGVQMLQDGITEARWLISGLRPTILDDFGVIPTVDHLVREQRVRSGLQIDWTHEVEFDRLAPPLELALFRVIQECLTNAIRHSKSQRISVDLRQRGNMIHVAVQDWGIGFDRENVESGRFGLRGIEERARVLGGTAEIQSRPGHGTCVLAEFPVVETDRSDEFESDEME